MIQNLDTTLENCIAREEIYKAIEAERIRQDGKWGVQNWKFIDYNIENTNVYYGIPKEEDAKKTCDIRMKANAATWTDIILEEFCEVINAKTIEEKKLEIVQLLAVGVAALESLSRNGK